MKSSVHAEYPLSEGHSFQVEGPKEWLNVFPGIVLCVVTCDYTCVSPVNIPFPVSQSTVGHEGRPSSLGFTVDALLVFSTN